MSARSIVAFKGLVALRERLAKFSAGLREAASGAVVERAAIKVQEIVRKVASARLRAHQMSGAAAGDMVVDRNGGLVTLHGLPAANGAQWSGRSYVSLKEWWPFRRGMPPFILRATVKIFEAELMAAISGRPSPLITADEEAEEVALVKSRAKYKADNARIWRGSAAGKAAASAKAKALRLAKKAGGS